MSWLPDIEGFTQYKPGMYRANKPATPLTNIGASPLDFPDDGGTRHDVGNPAVQAEIRAERRAAQEAIDNATETLKGMREMWENPEGEYSIFA